MPDIIEFLEKLGQDANRRHLEGAGLERALVDANLDAGVRAAILRDDRQHLATLLGVPARSCCLVEDPEGRDEAVTWCCLIVDPEGGAEPARNSVQ